MALLRTRHAAYAVDEHARLWHVKQTKPMSGGGFSGARDASGRWGAIGAGLRVSRRNAERGRVRSDAVAGATGTVGG